MMFPSMLTGKFSGMLGCQFNQCYNDMLWEKMLMCLLLPRLCADMLPKPPRVVRLRENLSLEETHGCRCRKR